MIPPITQKHVASGMASYAHLRAQWLTAFGRNATMTWIRWLRRWQWPDSTRDDGARQVLARMVGPQAEFREGQLQAIRAITTGQPARLLVVQRTGWGKSLVYFTAIRLLRDEDSPPALIVSPLIALMRNQVEAATRAGLRAAAWTSANREQWPVIEAALRADGLDLLLLSPERMESDHFQQQLPELFPKGIGLLVIDEAHCISEWGHEFRPDYQRLVRTVHALAANKPVLATTATTTPAVIKDVRQQLGGRLQVQRGPLNRASLAISVIASATPAERLARLVTLLNQLSGSGIIYCLTVADCLTVSDWLAEQGIVAPAYYAGLGAERVALERRLLANEVKALVSTVALGMGFDKPDLGFVIHYQLPPSLLAYYQQIGRAGRSIARAEAVLLHCRIDRTHIERMQRTAQPQVTELEEILEALAPDGSNDSRTLGDRMNISLPRIDRGLRHLRAAGLIEQTATGYRRTTQRQLIDAGRFAALTQSRHRDLAAVWQYVQDDGCRMRFVTRSLGDRSVRHCGRCDRCCPDAVKRSPTGDLTSEAQRFLAGRRPVIPPLAWPVGAQPGGEAGATGDREAQVTAEGRALCTYGDHYWGQAVTRGKYRLGWFEDALVAEAATYLTDSWRPNPAPQWVAAVPSLRRAKLVPDLAARLAQAISLPFLSVLSKVRETPEQKAMTNPAFQRRNLHGAFAVDAARTLHGPVLLVDDMCDSGATFAECAAVLRQAGSGVVYPFALAKVLSRNA